MTDCERLRRDAPGLVALPPDDPERAAAVAHASGCPGCADALRGAEQLQGLLGEAEPAGLEPGVLARAAAAIEEELVRERRRRSGWGALAAALVAAALLGLARHRGGSAADWTVAGLLVAVAVAVAALAARAPRAVLAVAAVAAAAAVCAGAGGPIEAGTGVHCLLVELLGAGAVLWVGWMALRGGTTRPARAAVAAAAAAGALAGAGALQVTCGAHGVAAHLLAFHAGGVALAAVAATLLWPRRRPVVAL